MRARSKALLAAAAAVLAARAALPVVAERLINARLEGLEGFRGRVEDVDLALLRGAVRLEGITVETRPAGSAPLLVCDAVEARWSWAGLIERSLVASATVERPVVHLVAAKAARRKEEPAAGAPAPKGAPAAGLTVRIDRLDVRDGEVRYSDPRRSPGVELSLSSLTVVGTNLTNVRAARDPLPSTVRVEAAALETGRLSADLAFDPAARAPTFELKQTLSGLELPRLNGLLESYGGVRVRSGTFALYTEIAAKDGRFVGYSKPMLRDVTFDRREGAARTLARKVRAGAASLADWVLSSPREDQVATRIPIRGSFRDPEASTWRALAGLLRNAFIDALEPGLDEDVRLGDAGRAGR